MASTPVEFRAPSGLTLTLSLFPYGSDTIANTGGDSCTEATNCKGRYSATVTEAISGWHDVMVRDGSSNLIVVGAVYMEDDTSIKRVHDPADRILPVEDGAIPPVVSAGAGGLLTFGSSTGQLNPSSGKAPATVAAADVTGNLPANVLQVEGTDATDYFATLDDAVLTAISNLNNLSALANLYGSPLLEIPDSSSTAFAFTLVVRDNEGKLVALDGSPTIAAANAAGTDRSANLSAVSNPATGRYTFTYTVSSADAQESLRITCSGTVSAEARYVEWIGAVVNYEYLTTIAAIKAKTDNLPSDPADQSAVEAAITSAVSTIRGADSDTLKTISDQVDSTATSSALATVGTNVSTLLTNLATLAAKFTGITLLAQWLGAAFGKQTANATALSEINATGAGGGTFAGGAEDSLEANRDNIQAAGAGLTAVQLADAEDVYHADIELTVDGANTRDEYTVVWFKNGVRQASGITSPLVQVVKRADGTDLIASSAMTQIGSTGSYKYDASGAERITNGEAVLVIATATIDSSARSFARALSRDSSA